MFPLVFNKTTYKGFVVQSSSPASIVSTYGNQVLLIQVSDQDFPEVSRLTRLPWACVPCAVSLSLHLSNPRGWIQMCSIPSILHRSQKDCTTSHREVCWLPEQIDPLLVLQMGYHGVIDSSQEGKTTVGPVSPCKMYISTLASKHVLWHSLSVDRELDIQKAFLFIFMRHWFSGQGPNFTLGFKPFHFNNLMENMTQEVHTGKTSNHCRSMKPITYQNHFTDSLKDRK